MKTYRYAQLTSPVYKTDTTITVFYAFQDVEETGFLLFNGFSEGNHEDQDKCSWELIHYGKREYLPKKQVRFSELTRGLPDSGCCIKQLDDNIPPLHDYYEAIEINPLTDYDLCGIRDLASDLCGTVRQCFSASGMIGYDPATGEFSLDPIDFRSLISADAPILYDATTGLISLDTLAVKQLFSAGNFIDINYETGVISALDNWEQTSTHFQDTQYILYNGDGGFELDVNELKKLFAGQGIIHFDEGTGGFSVDMYHADYPLKVTEAGDGDAGTFYIEGQTNSEDETVQNGAVLESRYGTVEWTNPWTPLSWHNTIDNRGFGGTTENPATVTLDCSKYYRFSVLAEGICHFRIANQYAGQLIMILIDNGDIERTHTWDSRILWPDGDPPEPPEHYSQYGITVDPYDKDVMYGAIISEGNQEPS